jgi:hypothetical protein
MLLAADADEAIQAAAVLSPPIVGLQPSTMAERYWDCGERSRPLNVRHPPALSRPCREW